MSLFWNSVFCLFLLVLLNLVIKRYVAALRVQSGRVDHHLRDDHPGDGAGRARQLQLGYPGLSFPFWFATPENQWATSSSTTTSPSGLTVQDPESSRSSDYGGDHPLPGGYLQAWIGPVLGLVRSSSARSGW